MEKLVIVGEKRFFYLEGGAVRLLENDGDIEVIGVCFEEDPIPEPGTERTSLFDYRCVGPGFPEWQEATCFLICTQLFDDQTIRRHTDMGIPRELMVPKDLLNMCGFSFTRYMKLARSHVTLISDYCWGGLMYHYFHLPFWSPTINLFITDGDYLKFLNNFDRMMEVEPVFSHTEYNPAEKLEYPVFLLDDVAIHMNHCSDPEEGLRDWKERRTRVNRDNMLVMMATENAFMAEQFQKLPFPHKICFVPHEMDLPCCVNVKSRKGTFVYDYANSYALGVRLLYDPWVLMEEKRISYLFDPDTILEEKPDERTAELIAGSKQVLIYGARLMSDQVYERLSYYMPGMIMGYAVTSTEHEPEEKNGLPIRDPEAWSRVLAEQGISPDDVLVVLALNPMYYDQVRRALNEVGLYRILERNDVMWHPFQRMADAGGQQ